MFTVIFEGIILINVFQYCDNTTYTQLQVLWWYKDIICSGSLLNDGGMDEAKERRRWNENWDIALISGLGSLFPFWAY